MHAVYNGVHRRLAVTVLPSTGASHIVLTHPFVQICLHLVDRAVDLSAERARVEFAFHHLMKALADYIGLRGALGFGTRVLDVFQVEVQLILVRLPASARFAVAVAQHSQARHLGLLEERQHSVVEHVGGRDRMLTLAQLGEGHHA